MRERAEVMRAALESLPEALREVVRLRLFEERAVEEVAAALGLGESAVKHRFLKGLGLYRDRLRHELRSRSGGSEFRRGA
ncbi:MAG: sigma factor-like helix-turn-helix DNA-binding protein [Planctomycetota bacterium]